MNLDLSRVLRRCFRLESGCLVWIGAVDGKGYGHVKIKGKRVRAHKWVYETLVGAVAAELTVEHSCRVTGCCEPSHLELLSRSENTARGNRNRKGR